MTPNRLRSSFLALGGLILPILCLFAPAQADPSKYPAFAQQKLPEDIKPVLISIDELIKEINAGAKPVIIDVRTAEEFGEVHILSAVSVPLAEFRNYIKSIPRDRPVVLYWACPHHLASLAYGMLYENGYRNMKVLDEGLVGWYHKRYPMDGTKVPRS